jgi:chemotaxis protein methyltransferase CheR
MKASRQGSELERVLKYLAVRTGLTFPATRMRDFELGIRKVMARYAITSAGRFIQHINADRAAFDAVVAEITVGETYFFREPAQFDAIRQIVLPSLLRNRPPDAPIRVWSAGCATGEEPYSIAILMEEEGLGDRSDVVGTDISTTALKKAEKGEYGSWSFRNDQFEPDARYFHRSGRRMQLAERIRSRVRFGVLNLASDDYPSPENGTLGLDLILCRNVLIYLDRESIEQIAQRLLASLSNGGWLITGPSDPPLWEYAAFTTVITPGGVFYRREAQPATVTAARRAPQHGPLRSPTAAPREPRSAATVPSPAVKAARAAPAIGGRRPGAASKSRAGADAASRIRAMANTGPLEAAEASAAEAVARHPLSPELHFVHSVVLIALERQDEAQASLRKVIYLDPTLAAAHLTLGSVLQRRGELAAARRAFATAHALCLARPAAEPVPLTDGDTAGRLAESAEAQIRVLDDRMRAET